MKNNDYLARLERFESEIERMVQDPITRALNLSHIFRRMLETSIDFVRPSYESHTKRLRALLEAEQADA